MENHPTMDYTIARKLFLILFLFAPVVSFVQAQPSSFNLVSPANGVYVNSTFLFQWGAASGANYYQLYIDGNLKKDNILTNYYLLQSTEALSEGLHTWNVKAVNTGGSVQSIQTWSLRVDATLPVAFDLVSPSDNSWSSNLKPAFQWTASSDARSGIAKYQLWIDSTLNCDNISSTVTTITPTNPLSNGSHSWLIKAIDNVGNVRTSTQLWNVNIDNKPPSIDPYSDNAYELYWWKKINAATISTNSLNIKASKTLTLEAWINQSDQFNNHVWFSQNYGTILEKFNQYCLYVKKLTTTSYTVHCKIGDQDISSNSILNTFEWHHIAATYDGNYIKIYIDGNLDNTSNLVTFTPHNDYYPEPFRVGVHWNQNPSSNICYFSGMIDEVRVWDITRTRNEIQLNRDKVIEVGNNGNLIAYYRFNKTVNYEPTFYDETANNLDLTTYAASGMNPAAIFYCINTNRGLTDLCNLKTPNALQYLAVGTPHFSWGTTPDKGIGFQKYQLFVDSALIQDNLIDSSFTLTAPLAYGQHTWYVKGFDLLGNNQSSYSRVFYVDNLPPNAFNLLSPNDSGIVNLPTPNLSWQPTIDFNGGSGLSKYQLWINGNINIDSVISSSTTTSPSNPLQEGKYTWFIRAYDKAGNYRQSFQTRLFYIDYNPPTAFSLISPASSDTVKERRPFFTWHPSTDAGSGLAKYELIISGKPVVSAQPADTTIQIPFDLEDGNYTWYVNAYDIAGSSTSSNSLVITVKVPIPPPSPQLISPLNNSFLTSLTPNLLWNTVQDANYFHAQISSDSTFLNIKIENQQVLNANWNPTLNHYGLYYWRVRAHSINGAWGNWSEAWKFKAMGLPNSVLLLEPVNGAMNQPANITFKWSRAIEPTKRIINYCFQITKDTVNFTGLLNDSTLVDTSKTISGLKSLTKYYWRVKSNNEAGWSSFTDWNNFVTIQVCSNVSLITGWNILSVPVVADEMDTQILFPNYSSPTYGFSNGYTAATALSNGKGYWLRYATTANINVCGTNTGVITIPLNQGWNLIGGYVTDITVANITTTPSGIISSPFYGYTNGYVVPTILNVGKGYWVRASQSGEINIPTTLAKPSNDVLAAGNIEPDWGRIIVTDNEGRTGVLYAANGNVNLGSFDLPPVPPADVFDLRYGTDRNVEALDNQGKEIKINSKSYPVTIKAEGISISLKDMITGKLLDKTIADGESLVLQRDLGALSIQTVGKPISYILEQNYPNPFNPSTTIRFAVPEKAVVTLAIYNVLGELVQTLVNEEMEPGYHQAIWNAGNMSSGIYFYKITTNKFCSVKKLMLMK